MGHKLSGTIAFASGKIGDYDIWACDLETGRITQLTHGDCWNDKPALSRDGKWVAFVSNRTGSQEIYTVSTAGGEPVQLTHVDRWVDSPAFSPDGRHIAYVSNEAGNNDLWIMDVDGENRRQVTTHDGSDVTVAWMPDASGLLWSSDRGGDADIWHFDFVSEQRTQLNEDRGGDFSPAPSIDGSLVAFVSNRQETPDRDQPFKDRDKDIWLMTADGELPVKLTENQGADFAPCWSPCGDYLLYTADDGRKDCHLRILRVAEVVQAFATGDRQSVEQAAKRLRAHVLELDRDPLKAEINAERHATFLTAWLPDSWMESCYPHGYFGLERNPAWSSVSVLADADWADASSPATQA